MLFFYLKDVYNRQKMIINKGISQERKILGSKFFHQSIYRIKLHKKQTKKQQTVSSLKSRIQTLFLYFLAPNILRMRSHIPKILSSMNSLHQKTQKNNQYQHSPPVLVPEKNAWERIGKITLSDLTDYWLVTMSQNIQNLKEEMNIYLIKKKLIKKYLSVSLQPFELKIDERINRFSESYV